MTAQTNSEARQEAVMKMRAALARDLAAIGERLAAIGSGAPVPTNELESGSALETLAVLFGLTAAEREILGLAAGAELAPALAEAVRQASGSERVEVALAAALRPQDGWDALCPEAPLRRWRLIELLGSGPMLRRHIQVDERVLQFLMGINYRDARLEGLVSLVETPRPLDRSERALSDRLVVAWSASGPPPLVLFSGRDGVAKREILAAAAAALKLHLFRVDAADIPSEWTQRSALATYVDRELALSAGALVIEHREDEGSEAAAGLADALTGAVAISAPDPVLPERGPRLRLDLPARGHLERRALWQRSVGARAEALGPGLDRLAEQFVLDRSGVDTAVEAAVNGTEVPTETLFGDLWQAARAQSRGRLKGLAERIETTARWDDLVLPAEQMSQLRDLAAHAREAWRVNQDWGWHAKSARGLGAAALFAGPSGVGKTLGAEVVSAELQLDLYRIDLSQIVSKYIGETEKNLSRIFNAAEDGGAILLFDEADALFGKRSEVKDSHDRYANVEVSYLLQRMEAYRGLAILTTNKKSALDHAFLRRLRYVVTFPFPDAAARAEIWARIFPDQTPVSGLDPQRLARMNLSGGSIRSIALNASFLAAGAGSPVTPRHLLTAARREYAKLEKPFTASEAGAVR